MGDPLVYQDLSMSNDWPIIPKFCQDEIIYLHHLKGVKCP